MNLSVEVEVGEFVDIEDIKDAVSIELEKCAYRIEQTSKEYVPVETGDLKRSINTFRIDDWEFEVKPDADLEYGKYIEDGTTPHVINGNPILAWFRDGDFHYAYSVLHPGNRPYLYLELSARLHAEDLADNIAKAIGRL